MEVKERYEVMISSLNGYAYIHDFITDNVLNTYDSCDLLNQQSKRIKELENMNSRLSQGIYWGNGEHFCDVVKNLKKENQHLKQQLKDTEESYNNTMRYLNKTRSELLNLHKKIVGEIEKCFTEYLPLKDRTGAWFYGKLNEILKKYGGSYGKENKTRRLY